LAEKFEGVARHESFPISCLRGGGFVLRAIGTPDEKLFDRFIMISPALPQSAPTIRPNTGGWVSVAKPRIVVLAMLNRLGIDW